MNYAQTIHRKAVDLAKATVRMTTQAGSGHPSSGLSLAHIVTVLMYDQMRWAPGDPWHPGNDRLVLSEGHAVPIVYAACCDLGVAVGRSPAYARRLTLEDALTLRQLDSPLDGHPNPEAGFPFFDVATGSLGQGLSAACGLGLAARLDEADRRFYVLIGDGESREGQVWEACDFLIDKGLGSVVPIFNANGQGQSDPVSLQQEAGRLAAKLEAFGFAAHQIDGHAPVAIRDALKATADAEAPHAIVARTVKGWAVQEFQRKNYHGKALGADQIDAAFADLDAKARELGAEKSSVQGLVPARPTRAEARDTSREDLPLADFVALLEGDKRQEDARQGKVSTRLAYGLALRELGRCDERVVALDGDVKNSTRAQYFADAFPERFFECRIAEQNMVSMAAGIAAAGKIPFVSSFAKFLARAYDQVEMALISGADINLVGSHAGANIGADGPSQMGLADANYFRAFTTVKRADGHPLVTVLAPADAVCAYRCVDLMARLPGATYMRTIRGSLPLLYSECQSFQPGGVNVLREGSDVTLLASAYMVHVGVQTCRLLEERSISAGLADCYSFPLQPDAIRTCADKTDGRLVTLEDCYAGALGCEVLSALQEGRGRETRLLQIAIDKVPKSALSGDEVLASLGLDADSVADRVQQFLQA